MLPNFCFEIEKCVNRLSITKITLLFASFFNFGCKSTTKISHSKQKVGDFQ